MKTPILFDADDERTLRELVAMERQTLSSWLDTFVATRSAGGSVSVWRHRTPAAISTSIDTLERLAEAGMLTWLARGVALCTFELTPVAASCVDALPAPASFLPGASCPVPPRLTARNSAW
jgi:hypothetical protein